MKNTLLIVSLFTAVFLFSCDADDKPDPKTNNTAPQELCDSIAITYDGHLKAIVDLNCNTSSCHAIGAGGFKLGTYAEVKAAAEKPSLLGAIKHEAGFDAMPSGSPKLSDEIIQMFECWEKTDFPEK